MNTSAGCLTMAGALTAIALCAGTDALAQVAPGCSYSINTGYVTDTVSNYASACPSGARMGFAWPTFRLPSIAPPLSMPIPAPQRTIRIITP